MCTFDWKISASEIVPYIKVRAGNLFSLGKWELVETAGTQNKPGKQSAIMFHTEFTKPAKTKKCNTRKVFASMNNICKIYTNKNCSFGKRTKLK